MNTKPLLAQLPVKSWATALSTYGKLALLFGCFGVVASGISGGDQGVIFMLITLFLCEKFFPLPDKVFISADYLEVNNQKILLDEILWAKKSRFTLTVADHSGDEVSFRPYYYENHAVERLTALLEKHASLQSRPKSKVEVTARWWGRLCERLKYLFCLGFVLALIASFLELPKISSFHWADVMMATILGFAICFILRAKTLRLCHTHLEIGDRKVLLIEITRVSASLGFVCVTDRWGCFYSFNPFNYDREAMAELRNRLREAVPSQPTDGVAQVGGNA